MYLDAVLLDMRASHADATRYFKRSNKRVLGYTLANFAGYAMLDILILPAFPAYRVCTRTQRCNDVLEIPYNRLTLRRLGMKCL